MSGTVKEINTEEEFDDITKTPNKLIVVDFYAGWCGPCKVIGPKVTEMAAAMTDVIFCKVDVDKVEEVTTKCGISAMPTFHGYKNGEKVFTVVGASEAKLREEVEKHK